MSGDYNMMMTNPYKPRKPKVATVPKVPTLKTPLAPTAAQYTVRARRNADAARSK